MKVTTVQPSTNGLESPLSNSAKWVSYFDTPSSDASTKHVQWQQMQIWSAFQDPTAYYSIRLLHRTHDSSSENPKAPPYQPRIGCSLGGPNARGTTCIRERAQTLRGAAGLVVWYDELRGCCWCLACHGVCCKLDWVQQTFTFACQLMLHKEDGDHLLESWTMEVGCWRPWAVSAKVEKLVG